MQNKIEVSTTINPLVLDNYRKEVLADIQKQLERAKVMNLEDGIKVHSLAIKRYEKAEYDELFRDFVMSASEPYLTETS
jgi:hypothetical protein